MSAAFTTVTTAPGPAIHYQTGPTFEYDTPTPTQELADPHAYTTTTSTTTAAPQTEYLEGHTLDRVETNSSDLSLSSIAGDIKPKREKEWRENFDLLDDEELLDTHGCAISKDILIHGRLYISNRSVAFKSNILGFKTKVHFPLSSITEVSPKMTALIIPNAIEIVHDNDEHSTFTTLPSRDSTLEILTTAWKISAPEAYAAFVASNPEVATRDRSSSISSARSYNSDNSVAASVPTTTTTSATSSTIAPAPHAVNGQTSAAQSYASEMNTRTPTSGAVQAGGQPTTKPGEAVPGQMHPATQPGREHLESEALDVRFATTPEKLWNLLYKSDDFTRQIWQGEGFTDIKLAPFVNGKRDYSYVKPLSGKIGPSSVTCYFSDEIVNEDADSWYGITTVTRTPDIPSGKSFEVHSLTTLTWNGPPKGGCRMKATSSIHWSGRSMIKSIINSSSIEGQTTYNQTLSAAVRDAIKRDPAQFGLAVGNGSAQDDEDDEPAPTPVATTSVPRSSGGSVATTGPNYASKGTPPAKKPESSFLMDQVDSLLEDPVKLALAALLAISFLINLYHTFFSRGRKVVVQRGFAGQGEEVGAMARLERIESEWAAVKRSFEQLGAVVVGAGRNDGVNQKAI